MSFTRRLSLALPLTAFALVACDAASCGKKELAATTEPATPSPSAATQAGAPSEAPLIAEKLPAPIVTAVPKMKREATDHDDDDDEPASPGGKGAPAHPTGASASAAAAGSAAPPGRPGASGVDGSKKLKELSTDEWKKVCDWTASQEGGYGHVTKCDGTSSKAPASQAECLQQAPKKCGISVSQLEGCALGRKADPCAVVTMIPACAPVMSCAGG